MRSKLIVCALLVVIAGCDDDANEPSSPADAGEPPSTDGAVNDAQDDASRLEREAEFWEQVTICGESVEFFPTVTAMADGADAVVVGRIVGASPGNTLQGDAAEDFYAEVNLWIETDHVLRDGAPASFALSLILPQAFTPAALDTAIETLRASLPRDPVVLLARARHDLDTENLFRIVNDYGLWAYTSRATLDNPIQHACHREDESFRQDFLEGARTLEELVEHLGR